MSCFLILLTIYTGAIFKIICIIEAEWITRAVSFEWNLLSNREDAG